MGFKGARPEIETAILYASYQTANPNHRLHYRSRHSPPLSVRFLLATRILRSRVLSTKCAGQSERTLLVTTKLDRRQPPVGVLPFGAAGGTGLIVYTVVQRVLGGITRATYSTPRIDPSQMMRSMQGAMPWIGSRGAVPRSLPPDMTNAQYTILSTLRGGRRKPKDIAKALSMDKKEVERETAILRTNGYLTKNNLLTTKGLSALS